MTNELIKRYPKLASCRQAIASALTIWMETYQSEHKLLLCGNGGSCADCDHIVGELMKGFLSARKISKELREKLALCFPEDATYLADNLQAGLPAISLSAHSAVLSAFANDVDPDMAYAQMVCGYGTAGDAAMGISTSGNSKNVCHALMVAKAMGLKTIGLTGSKPCRMDKICDVVIHAPESETYKIQEYHLPIYHFLCAQTEQAFFVPELQ